MARHKEVVVDTKVVTRTKKILILCYPSPRQRMLSKSSSLTISQNSLSMDRDFSFSISGPLKREVSAM